MASLRIKEELLIVFVYDTGRLMKEEEDPVNALVYFYPSWVSDQQKLTLCGQIIGTAHCVSSIFSAPRIISLRCGKFVFKHYENYILCVGTDRQAEDWCLQDRADLLYNLISLYHKDLDTIKSNLPRDLNGDERERDGEDMNEKLTNIFQVYLSLLLHASIFKHLPILKLPKSGSTSFSESMQLLQCFQGKEGVLGGAIMSRNKILASQLSSKLTKLLAISDPYRLQIPADNIKPSYRLPVGVQLLKVHLPESELSSLRTDTRFSQAAIDQLKSRSAQSNGTETPQMKGRKNGGANGADTPCRDYPPGMSRHMSTIFTVHEQHEASSPEDSRAEPNPADDQSNASAVQSSYPDQMPSTVRDSFLTKSLGAVNITDYLAPDRTNVNKHGNLCSSEDELPYSVKHIPVRYYSFGLPKLSEDFDECGVAVSCPEEHNRFYYNTVTDSQFPFFRTNGLPASKSFYNTRIKDFFAMLEEQTKQLLKGTSAEALNGTTTNGEETRNEPVKPSVTDDQAKPSVTDLVKPNETERGEKETEEKRPERPQSIGNLVSSSSRRKKIGEIELKQLDLGSDVPDKVTREDTQETLDSGLEDNFEPMTPLRAQLSQSTADLNKWASCLSLNPGAPKFRPAPKETFVEVALYVCGFQDTALLLLLDMESVNTPDLILYLIEVALFVCGFQDTALLLLLDMESVNTPDLILYLWEMSINYLNKLDSLLSSTLDPLSSEDSSEYSMLHLHPQWGMIDKSGIWTSAQLCLVSSLFNRLRAVKHLSEIIVKYDYQVIYCYQFANHQIFYHQNSESTTGLPPPSDLMGSVALKARRRLERDSQLIIL
ncbi:hypothetical protein M8J75_008930 [Diaphorina citri]|nr:hypothetical protein M8J75_008930 [Diaphorina citri]